jgi:hypothetical protein
MSRSLREQGFAPACTQILKRYPALSSVDDRCAAIRSLQQLLNVQGDILSADWEKQQARYSGAASDEKSHQMYEQKALKQAIETFGLDRWLSRLQVIHAPAVAAVHRLLLLKDGFRIVKADYEDEGGVQGRDRRMEEGVVEVACRIPDSLLLPSSRRQCRRRPPPLLLHKLSLCRPSL